MEKQNALENLIVFLLCMINTSMTILSLADRVRETSTTTGTGTLDLDGAVSSFQTFVSGVGDGATCTYLIIIGTEWEVGEGTVTDAAPDTLSRDRVIDSSTGGSLVSFSAGTKDVVLSVNAERMAHGGWNTDAQSSTFTADVVNTVYLLDISGGSLTANLPAASGNDDLRLGFKVVSHSGSFTATIDGSGAETIDGSTTQVLDTLNDYLEVTCDGTEWHIVSVDTDTHVDVAEGGSTVVSDATRIDFGSGFDVADGGSGEVDVTLDFSEVTVEAPMTIDGVRNDGGDIDFVAGANVTITPNDGADTITFASTDTDTHVDVAEGGSTVVADAARIDFGAGFDVADGGSGEADVTLDFSEVTVEAPMTIDGVRNDGGDIDFISGTGITITPDDGANTITIASTVVDTDTHVDVAEGGSTVVADAARIDFGSGFDVADGGSGEADVTLDFSEVTVEAPMTIDGVRNDGGDIDFVAGTNITITPDDGANTITITAAAGATLDVAEGGSTVVTAATRLDFQAGFDIVDAGAGEADISFDPSEVTVEAPMTIDGVRNDGGDIDFVAGANVTITPNDGADTITFASTDTDTHADVAEGGVTVVADAARIDFGLGFDVADGGSGEADVTLDFSEVTVEAPMTIDGVRNDGGDIDLVAGTNITITPNDGANTITIAATGGGTSINHLVAFHANDAMFPNTAPAAAESRNGHALLAYDDTTDENVIFESVMPEYYDGTTAMNLEIHYTAAGITTGNVVWNAAFERMDADSLDIDADSFAAVQAVTDAVAGTDGQISVATISFTTAQADGIQGGEAMRIKLTRDADNGSDTASADAQVLRVVLEVQ